MSILGIISILKPLAPAIAGLLGRLDPKYREKARMRKAINWGEKYIFKTEELERLQNKQPRTRRIQNKIDSCLKSRKYYRKWFFDNN